MIPEKKKRRKFANYRIVVLGIVLGCSLIISIGHILVEKSGIIINDTQSMPLGFYRLDDSKVTRGSIVVFCPPSIAVEYERRWHSGGKEDRNRCPLGGRPFLKIAAGVSGDRVKITENGMTINGGPLLPGSYILKRINEHEMPSLSKKEWTLKKGEIWAWTPQWFSFDSRYYGPVLTTQTVKSFLTYGETPHSEVPENIKKMQVAH